MPRYFVVWAIDEEADSAHAAAVQANSRRRDPSDPESAAVYDVVNVDMGAAVRVDLCQAPRRAPLSLRYVAALDQLRGRGR